MECLSSLGAKLCIASNDILTGDNLVKHIAICANRTNLKILKIYFEERGISKDNVVIINVTNHFDNDFTSLHFDDIKTNKQFLKHETLILFALRALKVRILDLPKIDKIIKKISGNNDFLLYLPHTYFDFYEVCATSKFCKGLILVEEGEAAYSDNLNYDPLGYALPKFYEVLRRLAFGNRLLVSKKSFFPPKPLVKTCIGLSGTFRSYPNIEFIDPLKVFENIEAQSHHQSLFLMIDALSCRGEIEEDVYLKKLYELFGRIKPELKENVRLCFHPSIKNEEFIKKVLKILDQAGVVNEVFTGDIEATLQKSQSVKLLALISSTMRYAYVLNVPVYSWLELFEGSEVIICEKKLLKYKKFTKNIDDLFE